MSCPSSDALARFADGELPVNEARALEAHLAGCPTCRREHERLRAVLDGVGAPTLSKVDGDAFARGVMRRLDEPPAREPWWSALVRGPRWAPLALAAVVLVVVVAVPLVKRTVSDDAASGDLGDRERAGAPRIQARGAKNTSLARRASADILVVRGKAVRGAEPSSAREALRPGDGLAVRYTNLVTDENVYLMAFALDAGGAVHWLYPAYLDEREDPAAVRLEPAARDKLLGEVTALTGVAPGPVRLVTVLASQARHVKEVERLLAGAAATGSVAARFADVVTERLVRQEPAR